MGLSFVATGAGAWGAVLALTLCVLTAQGNEDAPSVTPMQKVTTLLSELKAEVEAEGAAEAAAYDKFACFCQSTTKSKSDSILTGRDSARSLSAEIAAKTASVQEKSAELAKAKVEHESLSATLAGTQAQFAKEKAEYDQEAAELSAGMSALQAAIQSMEDSKPVDLLQVKATLRSTLALAEAMGTQVSTEGRTAAQAFMQVDPSDPKYKFHAQGIIDTLKQLLTEFTADKTALDTEWTSSKAVFENTIKDLRTSLTLNEKDQARLEGDLSTTKGEIAAARESLVTTESVLKDDQLYMKDLTNRCQLRAKDWDHRSQMRADELIALTGAIAALENGNVTQLDSEVNKRALLQHSAKAHSSGPLLKTIAQHQEAISLIQERASNARVLRNSLRGSSAREEGGLSLSARQERAMGVLRQSGKRLQSGLLLALSSSLRADPFLKVKKLIQGLVERLLSEATDEAEKKHFCDTELGKARGERDYRMEDCSKLDAEIQALELNVQELDAEIEMLDGAVAKLKDELREATDDRLDEKAANVKAIRTAKDGFQAVTEAVEILKTFYKNAAKATVLLQASPVDEDTSGPGFKGAYKGRQEEGGGVIALLEVILSDFDRTERSTKAAEKSAQEAFVEFDRASRADISGKETKKTLDEEDLTSTKNKLAQKTDDLKTNQLLLDTALKTIEDLKPTCIDNGMSYADRVAKRKEEITALNSALCILDTENVEPDCTP